MTAPRWAFTADRAGWSLSYGGVPIASSSSQKHAIADAIRRVVDALDDALADAEEANMTADLLTAWAAKIEGRTSA